MITFCGGRKGPAGRRTGLASNFAAVIDEVVRGRHRRRESAGDRANRTAWTITRNLLVEEPDQAALWMRAWANQNARVKWPVYHFGVSLAAEEHLPHEQWDYLLDRRLKHLGLDEHQAFIALRLDGENDRLHIVVNRVDPDARVWKPGWDAFKRQDIMRALERELGLRRVPTRRDLRLQANHYRPERRKEKSFARRVAVAALEDFQLATCWEDLEARLAPHGLRVEPSGAGAQVTDGRERIGLARVHSSLSGPRLADRYGETLRQYRQRRREVSR
ncbi:MAG: relaxase/mobilization nuclease domain-containing protein [bacterium]|nr:relaxase/mobilization nuclease domain-containing protein [bacterium]